MAPLMAIVDTTDISSHIVRSIEMPLREIINSTVECRISEMLKDEVDSLQQNIGDNRNKMTGVNKDIATLREEIEAGERTSREIFEQLNNLTKTVNTVNTDLDEKGKKLANNMDVMQLELQQNFDKHIGDNRNQLTEVKQDIVSLRKEMEERITREIFDKLKNFTTIFSTENKDLIEKVKNLTNNVDVMQSDLKETIVSVDSNVTNLAGQLENYLTSLEVLRSNLQELTVNTSTIQNAMGKFNITADINNGMLKVHDSKLEGLNATVKDIKDLETFVAPIVDNKGAPLVAIVNTTNISSHIVRSIEMPLREIINSTVERQINEKLKEDILSSKVLGKVNNKLDSLQQKIDEHMDGDNRNQMTEVNQYILHYGKKWKN
ncbi:unnamed protein product [Mytilus coruscus]|uniref:Uncharacterized protein n=1 Tax=Mytilus coruscus TaxID=42192 RepID=A0A6J8D259_MYTCO|nr:unnamed protein product [Mytilus coruscus]